MQTTTLTRKELSDGLAGKAGISCQTAHDYIEFLLETIQNALVAGRRVEFRNFGALQVVTRKARTGRNPRNIAAGSFTIPARRVVKFITAPRMRKAINGTQE